MIIKKIDNTYLIKIFDSKINIYNKEELEEITKKIIKKTNNIYKLNNSIHLEFFINNNYGIIIKLKDYKHPFTINNDKTVKVTIHTDTPFLYQIDYFNIKKSSNQNIYYYKNKFYLEINNNITIKDYYKLLESSDVIYENTSDIIDKAIKI